MLQHPVCPGLTEFVSTGANAANRSRRRRPFACRQRLFLLALTAAADAEQGRSDTQQRLRGVTFGGQSSVYTAVDQIETA